MPETTLHARPSRCGSAAALILCLAALASMAPAAPAGQQGAGPGVLPELSLPEPELVRVYRGNWENTLLPCRQQTAPPANSPAVHSEPLRPWKVDVRGHYPGWYPGVDMKHMAAAYLACENNLPLVLRAWDLTAERYQLPDGSVRPMTMHHNPQIVVPEQVQDLTTVYYPLRSSGTLDFILLGDQIYRYSRDRAWLQRQMPALRRAGEALTAWIDSEGLFFSDSYDLDQVYREIDGVAQASAHLAFQCLAALEAASGNPAGRAGWEDWAARLRRGAARHFWDERRGYYLEHLAYRNLARLPGSTALASSHLDGMHTPALAHDGILGLGIDAFGVRTGVGGRHEWAAAEGSRPWLQLRLSRPETVSRVLLFNRTDPQLTAADRFAEGYLEFSDGSPRVPVRFHRHGVSRAEARFSPRRVAWIRFTGTRLQGEPATGVPARPGLSEVIVLPAADPYQPFSRGMTDTNMAMVAFGGADERRAQRVWREFRQREDAFYTVGSLRAPTWIAERAVDYGPADLNKRAPYKDCVAMGRTWRYDALMRARMEDGEGILRTLRDAAALYHRPSGGGVGLFAERYGLGRFQPGDEAQATIHAYSEYPAVYNAIVMQQALLGVEALHDGTLAVHPRVPDSWYRQGFGHRGLGVRRGVTLEVRYTADSVRVQVSTSGEAVPVRLRLPPQWGRQDLRARAGSSPLTVRRRGETVEFLAPSGQAIELRPAGPDPSF